MSVRQSLLALLDQGPCYGYQLRAEFDARTGGTWPLNVGQIYNTLDRLERDELVVKGASDSEGHVYYEITPAGRSEVSAWLSSPVDRDSPVRDELAIKLALAATLPGVDVSRILSDQVLVSGARLDRLLAWRDTVSSAAPQSGSGEREASADIAGALVLDSLILHSEAELRWLESATERLVAHAPGHHAIPLRATLPRRGRPSRGAAAAS